MSSKFLMLLQLLSRREKMQLSCIFIAMICLAGIDMAGIASILPFMAVVANPDVVHTNRWLRQLYQYLSFSEVQSFLFFLGTAVLVLLIVSNIFKILYTWITLRFDNHLNYTLAKRLLASYLVRPYEFFLNRNSAEMGKNVLSEARTVIAGVLSPAMSITANALVTLCILILLTAVDPGVAFAIAAILGGAYAAIYLVVRKRLSRIGKQQLNAGYMKFKTASEALSGIKDLKILGRERVFVELFAEHASCHARNNAAAGIISQLPRYALETVAFGGILLIVLSSLRSDGEVGKIIPLLSVYAFAGYRLLPALQQIFSQLSTLRVSLPALDLIYKDLCEDGAVADPVAAMVDVCKLRPLPFKKELGLHGVTFSYSAAKVPAVDGVDLKISANSSIGLVGATGSGKTTVVDIILGLLAPDKGCLTADGVLISGATVACWQCNVGYVPQTIYLSDDTIARNIAFGVPNDEIDMAAVFRAARIAKLHEFIQNELPTGYNTVIGERGVRLSGGQRQRIGIARALYRDPAVLIMDEATSALDGITEEAVMDALRTLTGKKTIIMIAHRLTTVKDCDVIYLMEHGRIVSQGSYRELLGSSAWFQAAARVGT